MRNIFTLKEGIMFYNPSDYQTNPQNMSYQSGQGIVFQGNVAMWDAACSVEETARQDDDIKKKLDLVINLLNELIHSTGACTSDPPETEG